MALLADVFITSKDRPDLLEATLRSLRKNTTRSDYRLTVVLDSGSSISCDEDGIIRQSGIDPDHLLCHRENLGLGPSINQALAHIQALNGWYAHPTHGDPSQVAPFVCYLQDDVLVTRDWLPRMAKFFLLYEQSCRLGFASGIECVEHPIKRDLGNGMVLKDWIRAACMFGRRDYWMSMFPIPRLDPETGQVRARPHGGMGSGVDWWFVRDHENSVCRTGRTNLVFPGMMVHAGYDRSTWLDRALPESEADKERVHRGW